HTSWCSQITTQPMTMLRWIAERMRSERESSLRGGTSLATVDPGTVARESRDRVVEQVEPDGRLISARAPIRVYAVQGPFARLPDYSVLYVSTQHPRMRFRFTIVRVGSGGSAEYRAY